MFDYLHCKYEPYKPTDSSLMEKYKIRFNMDNYFECCSTIYLSGWVYSEVGHVQGVFVKARKGRFVLRKQLQYAIDRVDVFTNRKAECSKKSGFTGCYEKNGEEAIQVVVIVDNTEIVLFDIVSCDNKTEPLEIVEKDINYLYDVYPNRYCRAHLKLVSGKLRKIKGLKLFLNHDLGGGADSYLKDKIESEKIEKYIVIRYNLYSNRYTLELHGTDGIYCLGFWKFENLLKLLKKADISEIWINNLYTYPDIYLLLKQILGLRTSQKSKLVYLVHDYYEISPEKNLLSADGVYKSINDIEAENVPNYENQQINLGEWRTNWREFLMECDEVRCFCEASRRLLEEAYGEALKTTVVPHSMEYFTRTLEGKVLQHHVHEAGDKLHVGLLGVLTEAKGLNIVEAVLKEAELKNLPIDVTLIGSAPVNIESDRFRQTGEYAVENLAELAQENKIDIFLIPSVWPETFSYTTGEIMEMGYPVMTFDMGAQAERVKKYEKGYVVDEVSAEAVCRSLVDQVIRRYNE